MKKPKFYVSPYPTTVQHSPGTRWEQFKILSGMFFGDLWYLMRLGFKTFLVLAVLGALAFGALVIAGYALHLGAGL